MSQLLRLLNLRRNEISRVALAACVFFLVAIDDGIVKSVSAGVFNIREGVERLPEMYTWIAWLFSATMALLSYLTTKVARQRLLFGLLGTLCAVLVLNTAALVAVERGAGHVLATGGFYPFLFVSSELVRSMAGFQIWIVAGGICYTSRAKVLFPLLVASTTLGDIAGGFLVQGLGSFLPSYQIYGLAALIMGVVIALLRPLVRRHFVAPAGDEEAGAASLSENVRSFARSTYLRLLFLLSIALFGIYTAIHYVFNVVARQHFAAEGDITSFFGLFYGTAGVATLLTTTVLLRHILRLVGAGNIYMWVCAVHAVIALTLMAVFQGVLPLGAVVVIFAFNLANFVLLDSVIAPTYQVLIKLVPERNSDGTRMIMEGGFMLLGGLLGAGLTVLHARQLLTLGELFVVLTGIALAAAAAGWRLKHAYTEVLVRAVREQDFAVDDEQAMASMRRVVAQSTEFPRSLLLHRDDGVRHMGIEILCQNPSAAAQVCPPLIGHQNPRIRSAALQALSGEGPTSGLLTHALPLLCDEDEEVRLSAALFAARAIEGSMAPGASTALDPRQRELLVATIAPRLESLSDSATVQSEFLVIMDRLGDQSTAAKRSELVARMLGSDQIEEIVAGIHTAARLGQPALSSRIEEHLSHPHAAVREAAIDGLLAAAPTEEGLESLLTLLADPDPDVIEAAVAFLGQTSMAEHGELLVDALGTLPLKQWEGLVGALADQEDHGLVPQLMASCRERLLVANCYLIAMGQLRRHAPGPAAEMLVDQLHVEVGAVQGGVTRLLGRLGDIDVVNDLVERLGGGDPGARENAIELLENIGDRSLMELLLPTLMDDAEECEREAQEISGWEDATLEGALDLTMKSADIWTQMAAAWLAASLEKWDLLLALPPQPSGPVREIVTESGAPRRDAMSTEDQPLTSMEKIMFLKESPFFAGLPLEELYHIALSIQEETAKKGTVVIRQGTRGRKMYIVVAGSLEVSIADEAGAGEVQRIAQLGDKQVFGDMALLDDEPRSASVIALENSRLLSLQRTDLERILRRYSSIAFNMMRILSTRLRESMAA